MRFLLTAFIVVAFTLAGCKSSDPDPGFKHKPFIDQFMGKWRHETIDERYTMEIKDQVELIGIFESDLLSRSEFTILEVNPEQRYLIVQGMFEDLSEADKTKAKKAYSSKLVLQDNGNKLLYIYDYQNAKIESVWHR
jgi:hypothetical protein